MTRTMEIPRTAHNERVARQLKAQPAAFDCHPYPGAPERRGHLKALKLSEGAQSLRDRVAFVRGQDDTWPDLSDEALLARLEDWLGPYAAGKSMLSLDQSTIYNALRGILDPDQQRQIDKLA